MAAGLCTQEAFLVQRPLEKHAHTHDSRSELCRQRQDRGQPSIWASESPQREKEPALLGASWRTLSAGWGVEGHVQEDIGFT